VRASTSRPRAIPDGGEEMTVDSDFDEEHTVHWRISANRVGRIVSTSGQLYLTDNYLVFSPYPTGFGDVRETGIPFAGIRSIDVVKPGTRGVLDTILKGGFRTRIRIELENDREELFIVHDVDEALSKIRNAIHA
jgi:hypothetical protein